MSRTITDEHVDHWLEHGYVVVERFLDDDELREAHAAIHAYFPTEDAYYGDPGRYGHKQILVRHPSHPFPEPALNAVMLNEELISFCRRALDSDHVALVQSGLGAKYAGMAGLEQDLHLDYGNNDLAVPRIDGRSYQQVAMFVYYTTVTAETAPTHVVSMAEAPKLPLSTRFCRREDRPELYAKESPVIVPAGSLLIYGMRTWHRGSNFRAARAHRFHHGLCFADRRYPWQGMAPWAINGDTEVMDTFLERATPAQRELIGFPPVGHEYWNEQTLTDVAARYPRMDMSPYRAAAARRSRRKLGASSGRTRT
jgi:ectoine hydroxylase-related dioxygenase (phytanoyl-CoA dioxygenase family)